MQSIDFVPPNHQQSYAMSDNGGRRPSEDEDILSNEDWLENLHEWAVLPDKCVLIQKSLKRATAAEIEYA